MVPSIRRVVIGIAAAAAVGGGWPLLFHTLSPPEVARVQPAVPVVRTSVPEAAAGAPPKVTSTNCSVGVWAPRDDWRWDWPSKAPPLPQPPWAGREADAGCVTTRQWSSGAGVVEQFTGTGTKKGPNSRCFSLTKSAPCQTCCEASSCLTMKPDVRMHRSRLATALMHLRVGVEVKVIPGGGVVVGVQSVVALLRAWGLHVGYLPSILDENRTVDRRIVLMPIKPQASSTFIGNFGHWLSGVFLPLLIASWGVDGDVLPVLMPSCAHRYNRGAGKLCVFKSVVRAAAAGRNVLYGAAERAGMPWVSHLYKEPQQGQELGRWRLFIACESCPPQEKLPAAMPAFRKWIAMRYPRFSFEPVPPAARRRRLTLINRLEGGTRWIRNTDAMLRIAKELRWEATHHQAAAACSYAHSLVWRIHQSDVVVGFNGADLGYAAALMQPGSVAVEIIDYWYAYYDAWEMFQARFGSDVQVLRLLLPHSVVEYPVNSSHPLAQRAVEAARKTAYCYPEFNGSALFYESGCWRMMPSYVDVPEEDWANLLRAAAALVSETEVDLPPLEHVAYTPPPTGPPVNVSLGRAGTSKSRAVKLRKA